MPKTTTSETTYLRTEDTAVILSDFLDCLKHLTAFSSVKGLVRRNVTRRPEAKIKRLTFLCNDLRSKISEESRRGHLGSRGRSSTGFEYKPFPDVCIDKDGVEESYQPPHFLSDMASLYKSGDTIPDSGVYKVVHSQHRLPHQVTLVEGQAFPPCAKCHAEVRFELLRELPSLARERRGSVSLYALPVLDEEENAAS